MKGKGEGGRIISVGSALLIFLSGLTLWLVVTTTGTWGYFSNTIQELASISTGFWDESPGQSGTSIGATKSAHALWEMVDGTPIIVLSGEICVTNGGDQPTENLAIVDVIQSKSKGEPFEDTELMVPVSLGELAVLSPGESHCYPYDQVFIPDAGIKYRNVAYVTITNHSGWIPGGQNCPGPELCPFGPVPKAGFEIPSLPENGGGNISTEVEYLPDTGLPQDAEGKLIELPSPSEADHNGEPAGPAPTAVETPPPPTEEDPPPPSEPEENQVPPPTLAPTQDAYSIPTSGPIYPTPTLIPSEYSGQPGCTRPQNYWLDHQGKWPLGQFFLGSLKFDEAQALDVLAADPHGDASYILAQQYITALLNVATPADPTAIIEELQQAAAWFRLNPLGSQPGNPQNKMGLQIAGSLEAYNLGEIGPGSCMADDSTILPTAPVLPTSTGIPIPTPAPTMAPPLEPTPDSNQAPIATQPLPTPTSTSTP